MAEVHVSQDIAASQADTWAVFSDLSKFPDWLTIHDKFYGDPPTEIAVGAVFTEQATIMGMSNKIDWTVEAFEAPSSLTIGGKGLAGAQITFVLSLASTGDLTCTARIDAEFVGTMVVGAIGAAVERAANKEVTASLEKLAGLLAGAHA
ncbi:MAG: SRPBCC family protein [Propionibacteriales bacterium]|nr:SRPBCC family protein [Propionibacteriales bacterium]